MAPPLPDKIPCKSESHLKDEIAICQDVLALPETEDSWEKLFRAISKLTAIIKGGGYKFPNTLVPGIKSLSRPLISAMNSERTRLSAPVLELLTIIISRIDRNFEPLMQVFIPSVLKLCTRTNKLYITRARNLLDTITGQTSLTSIIPYFQGCWDDKSTSLRLASAEAMVAALKRFNPPDLTRYIPHVETAVLSAGVDKDPNVRSTGRKMFECYKALWPERVDNFTAPMTPITRRYLEVSSRPRTISTFTDTRDPFSVSVPNSKAARPGLRRSISLDGLNELNAPKLDRRIQVHQPEVTKVVPVRRAAKAATKQEMAQATHTKAQEESQPAVPPKLPKAPMLSRAISIANLKSQAQGLPASQSNNQLEAKGPRRVVQPIIPPTQTAQHRIGPSRANVGEEPNNSAPTVGSTVPVPAVPAKGNGERRGQGAQRIAIPPPKLPPPAPKNEKNETGGGPSRAIKPVGMSNPIEKPNSEKAKLFRPQSRVGRAQERAVNEAGIATTSREQSVARSDQVSKDSRPTSRAESNRPNSRLHTRNPPVRSVSSKTSTTQAEVKEPSRETRPAPVRRGLTAPTRAQLERAKVLENERDKAKPTSSSTRGLAPSKRGFIPVRGRGLPRGGARTRNVPRHVVKEEPIPEAQVPLPTSPKLEAKKDKDENDPVEEIVQLAPVNETNGPVEALEKVVVEEQEGNDNSKLRSLQLEDKEKTETLPVEKGEPKDVAKPVVSVPEGNLIPEVATTTEASQPMSEMDRLLFASPMKFEPPLSSSPYEQPIASGSNLISPIQVQGKDKKEQVTTPPPANKHDPYASLPFFLKEALAAPLPSTPNVRPSPFMRFVSDNTTMSIASTRRDEFESDATMEKLEFAVNGVDQFGRIIHSPCKKQPVRDALVDLSINQ